MFDSKIISMNTVTITTSEYNRLLWLKSNKKYDLSKGQFTATGFGIFKKKSFGKATSTAVVNKMRKAWRV